MLCFTVERQLEAVCQEFQKHALALTSELILAQSLERINHGLIPFRMNIEFFCVEPIWSSGNLNVIDSIDRSDQILKRDVRCAKLGGVKRHSAGGEARFVRFDRSDLQ